MADGAQEDTGHDVLFPGRLWRRPLVEPLAGLPGGRFHGHGTYRLQYRQDLLLQVGPVTAPDLGALEAQFGDLQSEKCGVGSPPKLARRIQE